MWVKSFKQYVKKKKFVGLKFTPESQQAMMDWAVAQGFDLKSKFDGEQQAVEDFDFHTTIFFTTSEHTTKTGTFEIPQFQLKLKSFELLGEAKNIPVIKVDTDNPDLMAIRNRFEKIGYKDAWPDYKPHISLSYKWDGTPDIKELDLPKFPIIVARLLISDQKDK